MSGAVRRPRAFLRTRSWWRANGWIVRDAADTLAFLLAAWIVAVALLCLTTP